ncbi:PQQ-like beta-propeller repeat protein [Streptomyces sp. NBC_01216]|uniref:outer membrane protein assembly factor BamB family protein n=1 Tax=Streptomyces sp. NBC_01216 TaxID=2903778 RepID=UPI002E119C70|nr:PQQ-like beta-propeller repeat protein [Streptomyces sp. NBC_01216]
MGTRVSGGQEVTSLALGTWFGASLAGAVGGWTLEYRSVGGGGPAVLAVLCSVSLLPALAVLGDKAASGRWAAGGALLGAVLMIGPLLAVINEGATPLWAARTDRPLGLKAVGSWTTEDLVIRSRPDRVTARALSDGIVAWRWTPPRRDVVCTMSRETTEGVALLGHAPETKPCTSVVALDLATGRVRWTTTLPAGAVPAAGARPDLVAAGHGLAVVPAADGWRGLDAADGKERWRTGTAPGCVPLLAHTDPDGRTADAPVVTVADCGPDKAPVLRTLTAGGGRRLSRTELPARGVPRELAVLAARPLAVWVWESETRGTRAVLSYDPLGRKRATVPVSTRDGELRVVPALGDRPAPVFAARPTRTAVVVGEILIMPRVRPGDYKELANGKGGNVRRRSRLDGLSLATGRVLWTTEEFHGHLQGLTRDGASVWALQDEEMLRIRIATGGMEQSVYLHGPRPSRRPADLWVRGDVYAVVNEDGTDDYAPVRVLRHS